MTYVKADFLKENKDALLIDCRFKLAEPEFGNAEYTKGHIKDAIFLDLDKDMMGKLGEHGGRHPLPDMDKFREKMESIGVSNERKVIIYDDAEFPSSARLWFMLQLLGKDSYIVNGGYKALVAAGFEVVTEVPSTSPAKLTTPKNENISVDIDYIKTVNDNPKSVLVDARTEPRHLGLEEPVDKIAGRIPGTVNIWWGECFDDGFMKSKEELEKLFSGIAKYDEVVFHCGSGVTGAVGVLAYREIGKEAKLYSGSYSDYISYKGNELIIKDNKSIIIE